ncbi:MAG: hypothetical protein HHJ13_12060 [Phycicoccus sp.]|nr:hypothetical protein [Phycicoccus sp.]
MRQFTENPKTRWRIWTLLDRVAGPVVTVLLSAAAMVQALRLWEWRPGDPMSAGGDANGVTIQIKDVLGHGWYGHNHDLGAPFGQDASWYPHADQLHLFLVRLIGFTSDNPFTVGALYFMLGFPLAALSMYWLARQRGLSRVGSVVAGVLFSVLPGHQLKYEHLWLASYWVVPLGMWLVLRTGMGEPLFRLKPGWRDSDQRRAALRLNLTTAFCVLSIAIGGIYYSAFTLLLLAVTLLVRLVATRDSRAVARAALLPVAIGAISLAALVSVISGQDKSTLVSMPSVRGFWESEQAAGKLMDLILPWIHHRVDALSYLTTTYNSHTTATLEAPALGIIAMAGVVALLVIMLSMLVPHRNKPAHPELGMLGLLSVVALGFYSIGGLGSFVALFVTPQIRTWSRLFVIIALFGLLAVGHWVGVLSRRNRILGLFAAVSLLLIGVLDQTNPAMAPQYQTLRNEVAGLTAFSRGIEAKVEAGCSVFQLPIVSYPEHPPVHGMTDYAHFRPSLVSSSLTWSYGAFRGTSLADWQLALPEKSTPALLDDLVAAGFCAVEVDRFGYADRGTALDGELSALLGQPIATTADGRNLAWNLAAQRESLTSRIGAAQVKADGDLVLHPVVIYSDHGAYSAEHYGEVPFQWTLGAFAIDVHNFGRATVRGVGLTFSLAAPDTAPRAFTIHLPNGSTQVVDVNGGTAQAVQVEVDAAPGRNTVTITTEGDAVSISAAGSDSSTERKSVFGKLIDLRASVADPNVRLGVVQQRLE